jgi:hypothetical protein
MPKPEKPRSEPEIIPPDRAGREPPRAQSFFETRGSERIYVARVGPFGVILTMLVAAIMFVVLLVLMLGAFLFWLPLLIFFIAGAVIAGFLKAYFGRSP